MKKFIFVAISAGSITSFLAYQILSQRRIEKVFEDLENFNKYSIETQNMDPIDLTIYNTIKENQPPTSKPHFPYHYGDNPPKKVFLPIELLKRFSKALGYEIIVLRCILYGGILCLLLLFILYYNVDIKAKALMLNYMSTVINMLHTTLTYLKLLKKSNQRIFPKDLPMTESQFEALKTLANQERVMERKMKNLLIDYVKVARDMKLDPKAAIVLLSLALTYLRFVPTMNQADLVLLISNFVSLFGSDDPNNPMT